ncbi:MAG TPA: putative nucleotidyltransferase substrate binding domain-containing protein, partial [Euzebyales bacterium]|nr:putative nucleotidyltransferase substrate binding domain-containing protein [Euzebyales bacterium]
IGRRLRRELVWTAVRDLAGHAEVDAVSQHLTAVATAVLRAATRLALRDADLRLAVIGLGRFGAGALGYASDLDVLVVFDPPGARDEALATVERLMSLVALIAPDSPAFTVDLGLRPEGRDGPLARTLDSYARYYERWAQSWEFLALTQARVVAGDADLGARWCQLVEPHVYRDPVPEQRLVDVRTMKARVERERAGGGPGAARSGGTAPGRPGGGLVGRSGARPGGDIDLKLGAGGLSDIEWTVQLLALAHGGADRGLRAPGTLQRLDAAAAAGHLDERQHRWLCDGWRTLSRLRNMLYLIGERHSHLLRAKPDVRAHAAQTLGYEAPGIQQLEEDLRRTMRRVRTVHEQVFY